MSYARTFFYSESDSASCNLFNSKSKCKTMQKDFFVLCISSDTNSRKLAKSAYKP